MTRPSIAALLTLLLVNSLAHAQPAGAVAATPATPEQTEAVLTTFRAYNDAMMANDVDTMVAYQHAPTDAHKALSRAVCQADAAIGRLKNLASNKFGADAAARVGKAVGDISNDDLKDAKVNIDPNGQAVVTIGDSPQGIRLVNVGGKWLFFISADDAPADGLKQRTAEFVTRTQQFDAVTAAVTDGRIATLEDLLKVFTRS